MAKTASIRARVTDRFKERFNRALEYEGIEEADFLRARAEQFVREVEKKINANIKPSKQFLLPPANPESIRKIRDENRCVGCKKLIPFPEDLCEKCLEE